MPLLATVLAPLVAGAARVTCVVDGDTLWYRGAKIHGADIDTPEIGQPACPRELALGEAASLRLAELLNEGPFTLARAPGGTGTATAACCTG